MKLAFPRFILLVLLISCASPRQESVISLTPISISPPTSGPASEPFLFNDNNTVYLSWVEDHDSIASLFFSQLDNDRWTAPARIATGNSWFVNWADYPMIASSGKNKIAHFLDRSADGKYTYDVKVTQSNDNGTTWSNPVVLHDDGKQAEHGFVSMLPYGDDFFISWLDGRNAVMPEGHEGMDHDMHHGAMSLRAAIIDKDGKKIKEWELDNRTCDCCQTTAAITPDGPVVIYRDRSREEIRDVSIVRLIDQTWTTPKPIHKDNWNMPGCPVNGPRSDFKDNTLAVAWYTSASDSSKVNVVFSDNFGESFGDAVQINSTTTIGRVDIALIDNTTALVTWIEDRKVKMVKVGKDGTVSQSSVIADISDARSSGFPQLTIAGDRAIVAWTNDEKRMVETAVVKL